MFILKKVNYFLTLGKEKKVAKSSYSITVIREGRNNDYRDFWINGLERNSADEKLHSGLVSFTELVEAKNLDEAVSTIQKKYPNLTISRENSSRLG